MWCSTVAAREAVPYGRRAAGLARSSTLYIVPDADVLHAATQEPAIPAAADHSLTDAGPRAVPMGTREAPTQQWIGGSSST